MDFSRLLEMRKAISNKRAEFFAQLVAISESLAQGDKCNGDLAGVSVRAADNATFLHRRMFQKYRFHFRRRYGESLVLDHLFAAVDHSIEAFAIPSDDVAGPIPAVAQDRGRRIRFIPITEHELRATHDEFTGKSRRRLGEVFRSFIWINITMRKDSTISESERMADRIGSIKLRVKEPAMRNGRRFGHPVALANQNSGESSEPARKLGRERSRPRFHPVNAMVARELPCLRRLANSVNGGWNQRHHGDALFDQQTHKLLHVEPRNQHECGAQNQGRIENYVQPVDVIERQTAQDRVLSAEFGRIRAKQLVDVCQCESITPFGMPVVPLE